MKAKSASYAILSIGAPLTLAVLEIFHPHPHDLFQLDLRTWLIVHYLQIPLFPLCALAVVILLRGLPGIAAWFARVAMFVFAVSYVAFDTAAGVVTGILLQAAKSTSAPEQWQPAVMAVWKHPVMGGAPGSSPLLEHPADNAVADERAPDGGGDGGDEREQEVEIERHHGNDFASIRGPVTAERTRTTDGRPGPVSG